MDKFAQLISAAKDAAHPTAEQARTGNYKKGRLDLYGFKIAIETMAGQRRVGKTDGTPWSVICMAHYGDISGTKGADGDPLDVFVGPWPESERAYVVNRYDAQGRFDEHKCLLCFASMSSAVNAYKNSYERGHDGLKSVVPCSIEQLKWWIKYGDHAVPLTANSLPHDGSVDMNETAWDANAQPVGTDLPSLMYRLRREDTGLLLDSVTVNDILEDSDGEMALDALVIPFNRLERKMTQMQLAMKVSGESVKPTAMQITPPFKQRGTTNVAVVYELSDGQTVSVYFHNPDTTPNKLTPDDEMVSWKWLLNKKDVTIVVAPERGQDLNPREVARRIMRLAERNSARFQAANEKRAERMAAIDTMKSGIDAKVAQLDELTKEIETLEAKVQVKKSNPEPSFSAENPNAATDFVSERNAYQWIYESFEASALAVIQGDREKAKQKLDAAKMQVRSFLKESPDVNETLNALMQKANGTPLSERQKMLVAAALGSSAALQGEGRDVTGEAFTGTNTEAGKGETVVEGQNPVGDPVADIDPTTAAGYAVAKDDEALLLKYQDRLDAFFQERIVAVRNAMRDLGWRPNAVGPGMNRDTSRDGVAASFTMTFAFDKVGSGGNVVGMKAVLGEGREVVDDLTKTPEQIAEEINSIAAPKDSGGDPDSAVVAAAVEAAKRGAGGITKLVNQMYFTFDYEGEDLILSDELRAKVEAALGAPLVEKVFPGFEGEVALIPEGQAEEKAGEGRLFTEDEMRARAAEEVASSGISAEEQLADRAFLQSVIDGTADMLDSEFADRLLALHDQYEGNEEVMATFNQAAEAYSNFMVAEAKKALQ